MRRALALAVLAVVLPAGRAAAVEETGPRAAGQASAAEKTGPRAAGRASAAGEAGLRASLARAMRAAGPHSGALVVDLSNGRTLYSLRPNRARVPASNQKLFLTAAALMRFGASGQLTTRVLGDGGLQADGTYRGNLYLRGGGDPTFGATAVEDLAATLAEAGIFRVAGSVLGDETYFDGLRGGPASGYGYDFWLGGSLSALAFERGRTSSTGAAVTRRPAGYAADRLARALRAAGIRVTGPVDEEAAPDGATVLAESPSPPVATLIRLTNVPSDNFVAEMLLKGLGARFGGRGSTQAGAAVVRGTLGDLGLRPRVVDGSGLSRLNRTSPRTLVRLLDHIDRTTELAVPFRASLAVACRSGTLAGRMCGTRAAGRCRGKTGTLAGVSALSGYCDARPDRVLAFSILMNRVNVSRARTLQDRMTGAIAAYQPAPAQLAGRRSPG